MDVFWITFAVRPLPAFATIVLARVAVEELYRPVVAASFQPAKSLKIQS